MDALDRQARTAGWLYLLLVIPGPFDREDINQLPVISDGHVQGVFSRGQVLRFLRTQAELHRN